VGQSRISSLAISRLVAARDSAAESGRSVSHRRHMRGVLIRYIQFCSTILSCQSFPVTYQSLSLFVTDHVVNRNHGSAKSLGSVLSILRVYCARRQLPWLSSGDSYLLADVCNSLRFNDTTPSHRKQALTLDLLTIVATKGLGSLRHTFACYLFLIFIFAHDGLLRLGELTNNDLRVTNFYWTPDRRSFRLCLLRSKTNRSGPPEFVTFVDYDYPFSAVKLLRWWFNLHGLWHQPTSRVFPVIVVASGNRFTSIINVIVYRSGNLVPGASSIPSSVRLGLDWGKTVTSDFIRRAIQKVLPVAGISASMYSGHSFRGGGATDLFNQRVPYVLIKKMGRWKSDVALDYWRDEADVAVAVGRAFSSAHTEWSANVLAASNRASGWGI
jgi:hypothetical protein